MVLRVARGLFRLWLVLSVLWIGGVGIMTWRTFAALSQSDRSWLRAEILKNCPEGPEVAPWDTTPPWLTEPCKDIRFAPVLALVPPVFVLALGSALVWALIGFR
jgi:hypothetical protein